jgi:CspA family cold shock protein
VAQDWYRRPQRRYFDEEAYRERDSLDTGLRFQRPSGLATTGTVKWYSPDKGFGFVQLADGSGDAFLHASVLAQSGSQSLLPGANLEIRVAPGPKGPQVSEVLSVDSTTALQEPQRRPRPEPPSYDPRTGSGAEEFGNVKFFNSAKGFGFVARRDGGKDVFVHASVLRRSGLLTLEEGQPVAITIGEGRRGPEVVRLRIVGDG